MRRGEDGPDRGAVLRTGHSADRPSVGERHARIGHVRAQREIHTRQRLHVHDRIPVVRRVTRRIRPEDRAVALAQAFRRLLERRRQLRADVEDVEPVVARIILEILRQQEIDARADARRLGVEVVIGPGGYLVAV